MSHSFPNKKKKDLKRKKKNFTYIVARKLQLKNLNSMPFGVFRLMPEQ